MRGDDVNQSAMFSYVSPEERVPADHPLRPVRATADKVLRQLSDRFDGLYSRLGRGSIAPEKLVRALLLQALYSIRSERLLMEQLNYNLLFRWFVGLNMDDAVWHPTVFTKNRDRLLAGDVAQAFFDAVLAEIRQRGLLSDEHFTVDGTLLEAWASKKSFQRKDEPPQGGSGSRGQTLLRDTHECRTDPEARVYRKSAGGAFQLCHMAHALMENRNALAVAGAVTEATTDAEWEAALEMLKGVGRRGVTLGADAGYDCETFVRGVRALGATPHVAQHTKRPSAIDGRTTRHAGYSVSLKKRKCVEQIFGWIKATGRLSKLHLRGRKLVQWTFTLALATYNLLRLRTLTVQPASA
jgi:transposase